MPIQIQEMIYTFRDVLVVNKGISAISLSMALTHKYDGIKYIQHILGNLMMKTRYLPWKYQAPLAVPEEGYAIHYRMNLNTLTGEVIAYKLKHPISKEYSLKNELKYFKEVSFFDINTYAFPDVMSPIDFKEVLSIKSRLTQCNDYSNHTNRLNALKNLVNAMPKTWKRQQKYKYKKGERFQKTVYRQPEDLQNKLTYDKPRGNLKLTEKEKAELAEKEKAELAKKEKAEQQEEKQRKYRYIAEMLSFTEQTLKVMIGEATLDSQILRYIDEFLTDKIYRQWEEYGRSQLTQEMKRAFIQMKVDIYNKTLKTVDEVNKIHLVKRVVIYQNKDGFNDIFKIETRKITSQITWMNTLKRLIVYSLLKNREYSRENLINDIVYVAQPFRKNDIILVGKRLFIAEIQQDTLKLEFKSVHLKEAVKILKTSLKEFKQMFLTQIDNNPDTVHVIRLHSQNSLDFCVKFKYNQELPKTVKVEQLALLMAANYANDIQKQACI